MTSTEPLLRTDGLTLEFRTRSGVVQALDRISFSISEGETVGIVGESGSGKSVMAYALMGLLDRAGRITNGEILYRGRPISRLRENAMRRLRGAEISMVFQNPRSALNPIRTVGMQLADVIRAHRDLGKAEARAAAIEMLTMVKIPDPETRLDAYPFELSGGMCQRVMIALALACSPNLLIADEPTTGLDVTTQAVIMDLLRSLSSDRHMATIFITHDLGLAAENCDRIIVMHAGQIVETGPTEALFAAPMHPYTRQLSLSTPKADSEISGLDTVPGNLPDLTAAKLPACRYAGRCPLADERCRNEAPPLREQIPGHRSYCWNAP